MTEKDIKIIVRKHAKKMHLLIATYVLGVIFYLHFFENVGIRLLHIFTWSGVQISLGLVTFFVEKVLNDIHCHQGDQENEKDEI